MCVLTKNNSNMFFHNLSVERPRVDDDQMALFGSYLKCYKREKSFANSADSS